MALNLYCNIQKLEIKHLKVGEQVLLKLNAYPYREFGIIKAKLDFVSSIPTDSGFVAKVVLPNGLVANNKNNFIILKDCLYRQK
jgi:hypothetical protein